MAEDSLEAENASLAILSRQADIRPTELVGSMYSLRGGEAVRHLFSVAAGLDSMIVGEAEVQGQVKRSYELASARARPGRSRTGSSTALGTGKRVRTETGVGRSHASVSSVAVELAAGAVGDSRKRVLVIGAGENGELTAKELQQRGVETVFVANRRYDRAIGLAQRFRRERGALRGPAGGARARRHRRELHLYPRTRSSAARSSRWSRRSGAATRWC